MTERERLTERIGDGIRYYDGKYIQTCYPKNNNLRPLDKLAVKLCEFEDKIENGMLVELPCKVGDTLYDAGEFFFEGCSCPEIHELNDDEMTVHERHGNLERRFTYDGMYIGHDDIGKTVFLTKEEAEKALAERSRG